MHVPTARKVKRGEPLGGLRAGRMATETLFGPARVMPKDAVGAKKPCGWLAFGMSSATEE